VPCFFAFFVTYYVNGKVPLAGVELPPLLPEFSPDVRVRALLSHSLHFRFSPFQHVANVLERSKSEKPLDVPLFPCPPSCGVHRNLFFGPVFFLPPLAFAGARELSFADLVCFLCLPFVRLKDSVHYFSGPTTDLRRFSSLFPPLAKCFCGENSTFLSLRTPLAR